MIFQDLIDTFKADNGECIRLLMNWDMEEFAKKIQEGDESKKTINYHGINSQVIRCYLDIANHKVRPFMIPVNQIIEFLHAKIELHDLEHFFGLKMPFEKLFIDFDGTLYEGGEQIKGICILRGDAIGAARNFLKQVEDDEELNGFIILGITKQMMDLFYSYYPKSVVKNPHGKEGIGITEDQAEGLAKIFNGAVEDSPCAVILSSSKEGSLKIFTEVEQTEEEIDVAHILQKIAIGFCLYVNSINVEVIEIKGEQKKKRAKQHKDPPSPYYWCKLETKEIRQSKPDNEGPGYSHRFEVRGHFKHFKKGKMAGRSLWCPPFIKGPECAPFRPKTYNLIT